MIYFWNYLWVGKLVIGLTLGLFIVRYIKDFILAIIIRLLPRRYRITANSANLHARVSTMVSFVLVFLIGGITYWGLGKAVNWVTVTEQQTIVNISPTRKPNLPKVKQVLPPLLKQPLSKEEENSQPLVSTAPQIVPTINQTPSPKPTIVPTPYVETYEAITIVARPQYYLQVSASKSIDKALQACNRLRQKWNIPCKIGVDKNHTYSYKIILGGFATLTDAKAFKRKYRIKDAFPRAKSYYDYIIEE